MVKSFKEMKQKLVLRKFFAFFKDWFAENRMAFSGIGLSLKTRNFRLYFWGMCISLTGTWMQQIAMSWLVYRLTGSVFLLATITFMTQIPVLLLTPFVGVWVDRFDRRRLLLLTQSLSALQAFILAGLTISGQVEVGHLLVLSLGSGLIHALDSPTRQAFYPSLVAPRYLGNAIALNSALINGSRLIGPAIGGILIHHLGEGTCFLINGISYTGIIAALICMVLPPGQGKSKSATFLTEINEGFRYVSGHLPIRALLFMMAALSFFGLPLVTFIPAYAKDILQGDSQLLGWLLSCIGIGSVAAALFLAARKNIAGLGKVIISAALLLGLALVYLSFIRIPWVAALVCIPAGFCIILAVAAVNTLLQALSDEDKRGRVMGYMTMAFTGISPIGTLFFGFLEHYTKLENIILLSGLCCLATGLVSARYLPLLSTHLYPLSVTRNRSNHIRA